MSDALPRVTAILRATNLGPDLSRVPPDVLEAARARGVAVHAAVESEVYGYPFDLPPEHAGYLDAYRKFVAESGFRAVAAEFEVVHEAYGYCGHPDVCGWLGPDRLLLDAKTGDATGGEYQVALYVLAYNAQHPEGPVTAGAVLHLEESGRYRLQEVDLPAAERVALAALVVYGAQTRRAV